jgi:hypothetical protein
MANEVIHGRHINLKNRNRLITRWKRNNCGGMTEIVLDQNLIFSE